jgi:hypothetical protein
MPDEKVKDNPTKKLQDLIKKRETHVIVVKQNEHRPNARRNNSGGFSGDGYSSSYEE